MTPIDNRWCKLFLNMKMRACGTCLTHARTAAAMALVMVLIGCRSPESRLLDHMQRGKASFEKKDYLGARIEFRSALEIDPGRFDAYYQLAQVQMALQDWPGAASSLDTAVRLEPEKVDLRLMRGQFYLAAREFPRAEEDARFVVGKDAANAAAHQLLAGALAGQQRNEEAVAAFTNVAELSPSDPAAFINLGVAEVSLKRFDAAERHFEKAIALDPKSIPAYINLAGMYRLQGRSPKGLEIIRRAVAANPQAIDLHITLADLLAGQPGGEADAILDRLRTQAPRSRDLALAVGNYYDRHDRSAEAIAEYLRGLDASPQDLELRKRLLDGYLTTGALDRAAPLDEALLKEAPSDIAVRINHARWLTAVARLQEAIDVLLEVVRDAPGSPQGHYFLAIAYWKLGDSASLNLARRELNTALQIAPDYRAAARTLIGFSLEQGDLAEAERLGRKHLERYPDDAAAHVTLGMTYLRLRRVADARREFSAARRLTPADPAVAAGLAQTYVAEQNWLEAERQLEAAMLVNPRSVQTLGQLADFWAGRKQPQKAVERIQRFLKTYPDVAEAHLFLGASQMATKDFAAAQASLERAIQLDPRLMDAYVRLGQLYQQQGQTRSAIARYEKALEVQPRQAPLCTLIGNLYASEGNLEEARKYYERALALDRNFEVAAGNLAWVQIQQDGNLDVAQGLAQDAVARYPNVVPLRDTLGWILYKKGLHSQAERHIEECVRRSPDTPLYHYHLAKVRLGLGHFDRAKANFTDALRLNLTGPEADDARRELALMK